MSFLKRTSSTEGSEKGSPKGSPISPRTARTRFSLLRSGSDSRDLRGILRRSTGSSQNLHAVTNSINHFQDELEVLQTFLETEDQLQERILERTRSIRRLLTDAVDVKLHGAVRRKQSAPVVRRRVGTGGSPSTSASGGLLRTQREIEFARKLCMFTIAEIRVALNDMLKIVTAENVDSSIFLEPLSSAVRIAKEARSSAGGRATSGLVPSDQRTITSITLQPDASSDEEDESDQGGDSDEGGSAVGETGTSSGGSEGTGGTSATGASTDGKDLSSQQKTKKLKSKKRKKVHDKVKIGLSMDPTGVSNRAPSSLAKSAVIEQARRAKDEILSMITPRPEDVQRAEADLRARSPSPVPVKPKERASRSPLGPQDSGNGTVLVAGEEEVEGGVDKGQVKKEDNVAAEGDGTSEREEIEEQRKTTVEVESTAETAEDDGDEERQSVEENADADEEEVSGRGDGNEVKEDAATDEDDAAVDEVGVVEGVMKKSSSSHTPHASLDFEASIEINLQDESLDMSIACCETLTDQIFNLLESYVDIRLASSDDLSIKELLTLAHAVHELMQQINAGEIQTSRLSVRCDDPSKRNELCEDIAASASRLRDCINNMTYSIVKKDTKELDLKAVVELRKTLEKLHTFAQSALESKLETRTVGKSVRIDLITVQQHLKNEKALEAKTKRRRKRMVKKQREMAELTEAAHKLTAQLRSLDRKINLLVKTNQKSVEKTKRKEKKQRIAEAYDNVGRGAKEENPLQERKEIYGEFVSYLRHDPRYFAKLLKQVTFAQTEDLVETLVFSLFSDVFLPDEELLVLSVIEGVMANAFEGCSDTNVYLRGNTYITKLLTSYTRRQSGRWHLVRALKPAVSSLVSLDISLEMDIRKIYESLSTEEQKEIGDDYLNSSRMHEIIRRHTVELSRWCDRFLEDIFRSLPSMPFGIRWLGKSLILMAEEKFPELTDEKKSYLLGSFIFLRYFNPAIITPESYGIVPAMNVTRTSRRNLVLVAKVLQNLVNHCPFGAKEEYMVPMNRFLLSRKNRLLLFYAQLINVGDPEKYQRSVSKLTKREYVTLEIAPNDLFLVQRCLMAHKQAVIDNTNWDSDILAYALQRMGDCPDDLDPHQNRPLLLRVPKQHAHDDELGDEERLLEELKANIADALCACDDLAAPVPPLPDIIEQLRTKCQEQQKTKAAEWLDAISAGLSILDPKYQENNYQALTQLIYKDYQQRGILRNFLFSEKAELEEALEAQKKAAEELVDRKDLYELYLQNSQQCCFNTKVKSKPIIGPYRFSLRELEKMQIVVPTPETDSLRKYHVVVKCACSTPGVISMSTKIKGERREDEAVLSDLIDELVVRDTVLLLDIAFNLKQLISFLNDKFNA